MIYYKTNHKIRPPVKNKKDNVTKKVIRKKMGESIKKNKSIKEKDIAKKSKEIIQKRDSSIKQPKKVVSKILKESEELKVIDEIINDKEFSNYIIKNIGRKAIDIITMLHKPITDEDLADKLNIKINEVRRILNTLNTYGITKYDTIKDKNGWLTFKWYINKNNIENVRRNVYENEKIVRYKLPENCNDFFVCEKCFDKRKVLFPFDTAVEMNFKCDCGGNLVRISKEEAQQLIENENAFAQV